MDRFISNVPVSGRQDVAEYFTDEYVRIINSKAKNKKQYKGENNVSNN